MSARGPNHRRLLTIVLGVLTAIGATVPIAAATATGAAVTIDAAATAAHVTVSKPVAIDPLFQGELRAVSCPSTLFCAAIGSHDDVQYATRGAASWSAPKLINGTTELSHLSCTSATFCMATTSIGQVRIYDGDRWSRPTRIRSHHQFSAKISHPVISCTSRFFCMAVSKAGAAFRYNGHRWSAATRIESGAVISGLSCATSSFCVATDGTKRANGEHLGAVIVYHHHHWSKPTVLDRPNPLTAVSCATTTFCAAVGTLHAYLLGKHGWSKPQRVNGIDGLNAVSCPAAGHCEAIDVVGDVSRLSGRTWSTRADVDQLNNFSVPFAPAISCASVTSCAIVDGAGYAVSLKGRTWRTQRLIDPDHGGLMDVSCATARFCAATDRNGAALTYDGTQWTAAHEIGPSLFHSARISYRPDAPGRMLISCPSPTFCVAADQGRSEIYSFDGHTWSGPTDIDPDESVTGLSCTSSSFCIAVDSSGNFTTFNGATWSAATEFDQVGRPVAVSCTSPRFCVVVDYDSSSVRTRALIDRSGVWSAPIRIGARGIQDTLDEVSCAKPTYCAAIGYYGAVAVFNGTAWTRIKSPATTDSTISVSCLPSQRCVIVGKTSMELIGSKLTKPFGLKARGISCPTQHHCIAVNGNRPGDAYVLKLGS
jgi:hypothetical protein